MSHRKTKVIFASAFCGVLASVAVFFATPRQRHVEPAAARVPALAAEEGREISLSVRSSETAIHADAGSPAEFSAPAKVSAPEAGAAAQESHKKATKAFIAHTQENTKRLYGSFFQARGLSPALQSEMTAILSRPIQALTDEASVAMRAGVRTTPPTPDALRAERSRQDQDLRSLLGNEGFSEFSEYRRTIPDRIIVQGMQRQGAELSDEQSQQMLQILTEERRKLSAATGNAQSPNSLPPGEAMSIMRQDQERLRDAVNRRVDALLTPEQIAAMGDVFERLSRPRMPRQ